MHNKMYSHSKRYTFILETLKTFPTALLNLNLSHYMDIFES